MEDRWGMDGKLFLAVKGTENTKQSKTETNEIKPIEKNYDEQQYRSSESRCGRGLEKTGCGVG